MTSAPDLSRSSDAAARALRVAGVSESRTEELRTRLGATLTTARAMNLAAAYEQLKQSGLSDAEADRLLVDLAAADLSAPRDHADAVAALVRRLTDLGVSRPRAVDAASRAAREKSASILALVSEAEQALLAWVGASEAAPRTGDPASRESPERRSQLNVSKGGSTMADSEKRNGSVGNQERERERERLEREREALDREREKLDRERERADREREKLDREREKLDQLQEALEERLERQEDRLQELEEGLEERMEALDEAASELDDFEGIEVEGIEGVREMLDAVTDRMPGILRGIQETLYAPERLQATAEAYAGFYKTLTESGMSEHLAVHLTERHFADLQRQMQTQMGDRRPRRRGRPAPVPGPDFDPLGPNFDPLGPNFDPFGRTPEPPELAEPAEPGTPCRE